MSEAVWTDELTRKFGDFLAVDRVSFAVPRGEVFGMLGPNGAGKTTTIKMLTGLLVPTSGTALVAGRDIVFETAAVKRSIGYMSQLFSLYSDLTVEENIRLFAGLYQVTGARYDERRDWVLETAGLREHRRRLTAELPLGWKQRLALGCAVLHEPPLLFLDEPTSGVDPTSRRRFWDLIYDLAGAGTTVLVSTHYMEEAEYCNRLALMNRGRLIALDRPGDLRRAVREPILEVTTDDPFGGVEALTGAPGIMEAAMFGRLLHVMVADLETGLRDVPHLLESAGRTCESVRQVDPSLEDVFVTLVRREGGAQAG
ncbi:MAG: ATP-binding cassette domain-containing protein [Gemmatimonadales bacterium]